MTKKQLIAFENKVAQMCREGKIGVPVHLCGSVDGRYEDDLINLFKRIGKDDYVFSGHRNHYHYLLKGGTPKEILNYFKTPMGSMHIINPKLKFYSSAILSGCVAIAAGVAKALKMKGSSQKVWIFIGDGASDEGWFFEALRYSNHNNLPITFIVEDNDRSVEATTRQRWNGRYFWDRQRVIHITYVPKWQHAGPGEYQAI
jgi:pyruvate dehydrogenase E1 component alpha subunit